MPDITELATISTWPAAFEAWAFTALPNVIAALLILTIGWWIARRASFIAESVLGRQTAIDKTLLTVLTRILRYLITIIAVITALGQLGFQTTSLLAALGAAGLAVGLALQGTLSNIAAGIMVLWLRPYKIGEFIKAGGVEGTVADVGLFATTLRTVEGVHVFAPNNDLWQSPITNFTRNDTRMIREVFTISYDDDIQAARQILLDTVSAHEKTHKEPEPSVMVAALGDTAVGLEVRAWTNTPDFVATRYALIEHAKIALEAGGVSIPYPQQDLHIRTLPQVPDGKGGVQLVSVTLEKDDT